jgi:hypothetical protein
MNDRIADLQAVVVAALAPLAARIEQLFVEQQEQADTLAQLTARLDEIAEQVALLRGQALLLDRRTEDTARLTYGARNIVMQAEHHMQQEVASVNERLLDLTADIHRLHSIRESPEHELYRLCSEMAVIQRRLSQLEGTGASS